MELGVLEDFHKVNKDGKSEDNLGIGLELELRVEVELSNQESTKDMLCENLNDTPFNIEINFVSEYQSKDTESQLNEPA